MKIFKNQDINDFAISPQNIFKSIKKKDKPILFNPLRNKNLIVKKDQLVIGKNYKLTTKDIRLIGNHNLVNIAFAITICSILKDVTRKQIDLIKKFKSLDHRLEIIKKKCTYTYNNNR